MNKIKIPTLRSARGFTLIELMIAVAIIGILVKLAYPAYTQSVKKSRRPSAKTALLDLAQREERFMSTNNAYSVTATPDLGYSTGTTFPINVSSGSSAYYQLSVTVTAATATTAAYFKGTATRINAQTADAECGDYSIDSTGAQTIANATSTAAACW
jgi:type IV pilus assembly protein PilE